MEQKVDKRILKSKKAIQDAFKELIQEKELADISICELTKRAGVTRSTFYLYYQKASDVRDDIENNILNRISKIISGVDLVKCMLEPYPLLQMVCNEVLTEDVNNKYIFVGKEANYLLDRITDMVVETYIGFVKKYGMESTIQKVKYIATFVASGITASFKRWFIDGKKEPLEDFCKELSTSISKSYAVLTSK